MLVFPDNKMEISMKKIYTLLVICLTIPLSVLASSTNVNVKTGLEVMSSAEPCQSGGGND